MAAASLKSIAKLMKGIDLCMLTTSDMRGVSSSRPMSNNKDVDYDGTSYFFTLTNRRMIREIKKNPRVSLQFANTGLLKKPTFISVSARAKLVTDREEMTEHWNVDLERWFKDGLDTRGLVMIEAQATYIKYWSGYEEGEFKKSSR